MQRPLRIVCGRETQTSITESVHKLLGDRIRALNLQWFYEVMKYSIVQRFPDENGRRTEFTFIGLLDQDVHNIKSLEGADILWVEEAAKISEYAWDIIAPTVRKPGSEIWISFNPQRSLDETYQRFVVRKRTDCISVKTGWEDNVWMPDELRAEKDETFLRSPLKYRNIWGGEPITESQGALWTAAMVEASRLDLAKMPPLQRVVVAIDPAVTANEHSDETGIVAVGLAVNDHCYVLEDVSGKYSPKEWAWKAIALGAKWSADRVVAEVNNGGDLVEQNLRAVSPMLPFRKVHASRGKLIRAEPASSLYEQGRVHHVARLETLEDQMVTWSPQSGERSPDRLDALVWALFDLVIEPEAQRIIAHPYQRVQISPY